VIALLFRLVVRVVGAWRKCGGHVRSGKEGSAVILSGAMIRSGVRLLSLAMGLYQIRKLRASERALFDARRELEKVVRRQADNSIAQIESLLALYLELGLERSLPSTRGFAASPDFLLALIRHARQVRPACYVECGSGVSTIVLARCAALNATGHVYALEHDEGFAERTRQELDHHGLSELATVLHAPLEPTDDGGAPMWYADRLPHDLEIDVLVVDGPPEAVGPTARYPAGPRLFAQLRAGAKVFLDDANRDGERAVIQRWAREFPELVIERRDLERGCAVLTKPSSDSTPTTTDAAGFEPATSRV
jgi:predicted O-methyltransferase YrrM